ncbi:hypothetical protein HYC85_005712 [Camellia sinensis]|uniref:tRNA (guanine(26)-N(2))-dimethyltransferase n=1 Tax=Camellia sinensis TaxID=4442 RepID=A0A7J7I1F9_CAMSI|nr:hypothetical protein HYC85_005712 [Camellia sinensis]
MGDNEKTGEGEKQGSKTVMSSDLNDFTIIKEGDAEILMHAKNEVFYNKTQVNNRDISIAVLRTFISKRKEEHETKLSRRTKTAQKVSGENVSELKAPTESDVHNEKSNGECEESEEISPDEPCSISEKPVKTPEGKVQGELKPPRVLEALSASGLRALRYAREVEGIGQVVAVDNDKASVEACRRNIKFNGSVACAKVESHLADARVYMLTHPKEFDVVDLDPYGSPSVFLDSTIQSVVDGGMLMCTATDMAVLCGGNGEVCYSKYGSYPLRGKYCHEMALRILLACIESHANRYKRYIVPVLSVQMDFYVRVFVRSLGRTVSKNNSVRYLPGFGPVVSEECSDCGKKYNMGGPIWSAPIHDQEWELPDVPLFLSLHNLCATSKMHFSLGSNIPICRYRISGTHVNPLGLKSDAPMDVIWDIMRCWVKNHPVKAQPPDQAGSVILAKQPVLQANFARAVASLSKAQAKKVARFLPNPERHWGPKLRAGRTITSKHVSLLGPQALNEINNHEEEAEGEGGDDEPQAKRKKTEDPTSIS